MRALVALILVCLVVCAFGLAGLGATASPTTAADSETAVAPSPAPSSPIGDLGSLLAIPVITGLLQGVKRFMSSDARQKYLVLIAQVFGILALALITAYMGKWKLDGQTIAGIVLYGMTFGLSAVGLYNQGGDLKLIMEGD